MPMRVLALAVLLALFPIVASAQNRVALIIGNGAYTHVPKLPNPPHDAETITALFQSAGFNVVEAKRDLDGTGMRRTLRDFSAQVHDADVAVVYFAGHGIEVNGTNYLIPVDAVLERDIDVEDETVSLDRVTQLLEPAKRLRFVILDACRDNPFLRSIRRSVASRSIGRGLAEVRVLTSDTLVAFAARAGSTAADGEGTNSPYTSALVKHLITPGLDLRLALGRVRDEVLKTTANRQEPFVYGSLGGAEIPLLPTSVARSEQPQQSADVNRNSEAAETWDRVKGSTSAVLLEAFAARYKDTFYADLARSRIEDVRHKSDEEARAKRAEEESRRRKEEAQRQADLAETVRREIERNASKQAEQKRATEESSRHAFDGRWRMVLHPGGGCKQNTRSNSDYVLTIKDRQSQWKNSILTISDSGQFRIRYTDNSLSYSGTITGNEGKGTYHRPETSNTFACNGTFTLKRE